jgi:hypothetical protein
MSTKLTPPPITPGPWKLIQGANTHVGIMHPELNGVALAWCNDELSPVNGHHTEPTERKANLEMMNAAPKMAAALYEMLDLAEFDLANLKMNFREKDVQDAIDRKQARIDRARAALQAAGYTKSTADL